MSRAGLRLRRAQATIGLTTPFEFNLERDPIYECGAAPLTVLAAAADIAHERSLDLRRSLCGKALCLQFLMNPNDWTPITVKPQYVFQDRKTIDRDVHYVEKRIGERIVAGRIAIAFLQRIKLGDAQCLPRTPSRQDMATPS